MLWPTSCAVCGTGGPSPCGPCARTLLPAGRGAEAVEGLDACRSLLAYEGAARRLVTGLKYRNDRAALAWLAGRMAGLMAPPPGTVVTWAPTTAARRRRRGYDQAEVLAAAVARRWGLPCRPLLARRRRPGGGPDAQTGASAADRRRGPTLVARRPVTGPVVVVDDVTTTGATLRAAGAAIRAAGSPWVAGLTAARTPRRAAGSPVTAVMSHSVPGALRPVNKALKSAARPADKHR
jgi:predicted amidophosphoribosyltransferase